jgi:hypothetical protein
VLVGHLLVLAAALTCLRLGWWQWGVAHQTRGTAQNLGYALLWPVFAGAFLYMWLRFLHLESVRDAELAELTDGGPADGGDASAGADPAGGDGTSGDDAADRDAPGGVGHLADDAVNRDATGGMDHAGGGAVDHAAEAALHAAEGAEPDGADRPTEQPTAPDDTAEGSSPAIEDASVTGSPDTGRDSAPGGRARFRRRTRRPPPESYTIAVATVGGDDDDDDPELAAYNAALAALAEQDRRRAR